MCVRSWLVAWWLVGSFSPLEERVVDQPGLARAYRGQLKQDVQRAFTCAHSAMEELFPSKLSSHEELAARTHTLQHLYRTVMLEVKVAENVSWADGGRGLWSDVQPRAIVLQREGFVTSHGAERLRPRWGGGLGGTEIGLVLMRSLCVCCWPCQHPRSLRR
jgi:hypothetical protein